MVSGWAALPIPAEKPYAILLNGVWRFKLEQAPAAAASSRRGRSYYSDPLPGHHRAVLQDGLPRGGEAARPGRAGQWREIAGYSPATDNQPDNASGLYRLKFQVPAQWQGRLVKINFDGVQNGCANPSMRCGRRQCSRPRSPGSDSSTPASA